MKLSKCDKQWCSQGGGGGAIDPPSIGMSTKMQSKKYTTFLALLRLLYALE